MKNKLLLTTALVGVAFAMPTMAAEEWDGKTSYLIPQGETLVLEENSLVENITNNADGIGGALSTSKPKMELKILVRLSSNQEQYLKTIRQNMMAAQLPTLAF